MCVCVCVCVCVYMAACLGGSVCTMKTPDRNDLKLGTVYSNRYYIDFGFKSAGLGLRFRIRVKVREWGPNCISRVTVQLLIFILHHLTQHM